MKIKALNDCATNMSELPVLRVEFESDSEFEDLCHVLLIAAMAVYDGRAMATIDRDAYAAKLLETLANELAENGGL